MEVIMNFFKSLVKELEDDNTHFADEGGNSAEFSGWIDTGSYILNAVLSGSIYGGVPNNKITAFAGEAATGKTFFVLGLVRKFLEDNKNAAVFYYDTEAAVTREMMESRGIDVKRVIIVEPETIQDFRRHALNVLDKYIKENEKDRPPMMLVLDSLAQLTSIKELTDSTEGKDTRDMTKAQLLKATFRALNLRLAKARVPLLITNHVYDVIGSYVPTKEMGGGSGLKYAASQIIFLSKKKDRDGNDVVGNIIHCKMTKSRFTKENKMVDVRLSYTTGLDRHYGLLDLAEKYGVIKKVSTRYEMPDGSKVFGKAINENPEEYFTDDLLNKLEECCAKEFKYGMIGIEEKEEDHEGND